MDDEELLNFYIEDYYRVLDDRSYYSSKADLPSSIIITIIVASIPYFYSTIMSINIENCVWICLARNFLLFLLAVYLILFVRLIYEIYCLLYNYQYGYLPYSHEIEEYKQDLIEYYNEIGTDKDDLIDLINDDMKCYMKKRLMECSIKNNECNDRKAKIAYKIGVSIKFIVLLASFLVLLLFIISVIL